MLISKIIPFVLIIYSLQPYRLNLFYMAYNLPSLMGVSPVLIARVDSISHWDLNSLRK